MQNYPLTTCLDLAGSRHGTRVESTVRCRLRSEFRPQEESGEKAEDLCRGVKVLIGL